MRIISTLSYMGFREYLYNPFATRCFGGSIGAGVPLECKIERTPEVAASTNGNKKKRKNSTQARRKLPVMYPGQQQEGRHPQGHRSRHENGEQCQFQ